jgi:hypothetical protein
MIMRTLGGGEAAEVDREKNGDRRMKRTVTTNRMEGLRNKWNMRIKAMKRPSLKW